MKLTIKMSDTNDVKNTKSFDSIPDGKTDNNLKELALKYAALTNSVATTAQKIVTTDLALN